MIDKNSQFERTEDNTQLTKSVVNIALMFERDENLQGLFAYNEFFSRIEYARDAIWHNIKKGKMLQDEDLVHVQYYLAFNKKFEITLDKIQNAITELSHRYRIHPVRDYLNSLDWDNIGRLDEWLIKGCGTEDNQYTREIGRKWLCAAVARIYRPAIKFDHVLVLEGKENIGKSSALAVLGGDWFCDGVDLSTRDKDIVDNMQGRWIIELAEMKGITAKDVEWIKSFISRQVDVERLSYRRFSQEFKRQSIFAGTSNKMGYLLDETGNRRFWPVECLKIDIPWIKENRDQLFAEAIVKYNSGEKLYLENETYAQAKLEQVKRLSIDDVWEDETNTYVRCKNETTVRDVLINCLHFTPKDIQLRHTQMIGRILKKLGFEKEEKFGEDGSRFRYVRMGRLVDMELTRLKGDKIEWQD